MVQEEEIYGDLAQSARRPRSGVTSTETASPKKNGSWTFLSNHTHVLLCLARDPEARLRDIAERVGMTERGVFRVVTELEQGGVITRIRNGRRNRYEIDISTPLRHHLEEDRTVGGLLAWLLQPDEAERLGLPADEASRLH